MVTYHEQLAELAELETFDPAVFLAGDETSQDVCDFVLSLALVFDDIRDLVHAQRLLSGVAPIKNTISKDAGQFGGMHSHIVRTFAGVLRELAELIRTNEGAISSPVFRRVLKTVGKPLRTSWEAVVAAARSTSPRGDQFGRYFARNKVAFHYDTKEIARGYKLRFCRDDSAPPYISRGRNMAQSRFYFADAAAEAYMFHESGATTGKEFFTTGWQILPQIAISLREIVIGFVIARGYAWRPPEPPDTPIRM